MFKNKNVWRGGAYLFTALIFVGQTAGSVLEANRNVVDGFLGTKSYQVINEGGSEEMFTTFTADYSNTDDLVAAHEAMGELVQEEGTVLLKNNGALPLAENERNITLLGLRAEVSTLYGATIGVSVPAEQNISLPSALEERGFTVNHDILDAYQIVSADIDKNANKISPSFSGVLAGAEPVYNLVEPMMKDVTAANSTAAGSISQYGDAAIVVLGRPGSEAADYYPGETGVDTSTGARNSLALSDAERDTIAYAKQNFEKVIVLLNSANAMEIDELAEDDGIDAILWTGLIGNYGSRGIADILTGAANPSGGLVDIFASDTTSTPAMANFGVIPFTNAADYLDTAVDRGDFYLVEAEGIYTGYRYYETRYADVVMGQGNAASETGTFDSTGAWNYSEEVTYPFGYGLSYTTFERHLDSIAVDTEAQTITATVTVTNTGDVAGKTPVQLYGSAPYIQGGVEKSAVQLIDYAKSDLLEPGASQSIAITADLQNLSSYDYQGLQKYILDGGDYYFTVANGSHEAVNNVLAAQGYTMADGMDSEGDRDNTQVWNYEPENGVDADTFAIGKGGAEVSNHLDDADLNTWLPGMVTTLSRSDWEGTWPRTYDDIAITEEMVPYLTNDFYKIADNDDVSGITYGAENGLIFANMKGLAYDDPKWETLLDQLDLQQAVIFITQGNRNYADIDSIGFIGGQFVENGPNGFNVPLSSYSNPESPWYVSESDPNAAYVTSNLGCAGIIAASFNKVLAHDLGVLWGNDSLFNNLPLIWAPGLNLHRSAYNGRNCEYYSEDPVLAGYTGLEMALGGLEKGLIMAPKHFAFNDQESNRNGVAPFMNEQKARELELRSFQIAFEGGTLGAMTSFSRIGVKYVGGHEGLLTDILTNEWGFHGYVISDMVNPGTYMTWKESVIAGTTNFDTTEVNEAWAGYMTATTNTFGKDAAMLTAIRERMHNSLYAFAQSNLMNTLTANSRRVEVNVWWRLLYKGVFYGSIVLAALCLLGYILCVIRGGKAAGTEKKEN